MPYLACLNEKQLRIKEGFLAIKIAGKPSFSSCGVLFLYLYVFDNRFFKIRKVVYNK